MSLRCLFCAIGWFTSWKLYTAMQIFTAWCMSRFPCIILSFRPPSFPQPSQIRSGCGSSRKIAYSSLRVSVSSCIWDQLCSSKANFHYSVFFWSNITCNNFFYISNFSHLNNTVLLLHLNVTSGNGCLHFNKKRNYILMILWHREIVSIPWVTCRVHSLECKCQTVYEAC